MAGRSRWLAALVSWWVVAGPACNCGANLTDDAGDVPLNPAETLDNPCVTDSECDDGRPCNGLETCSPETGRCVGGEPPPDFTQCRTRDGHFASCVDGRCDLDYEEMFVPAGPFVMGRDPWEHPCYVPTVPAEPEHVVTLSGYFIDRYEVTNQRYHRCQRHGACPIAPPEDSFTRRRYYTVPGFAQYPALGMQWYGAVDYCAYEGKRLATEAEWEKAARGGCEVVPPETCGEEDERRLPWDDPPFGDEGRDCEHANWSRYVDDACPNDTDRVGIRLLGRSPYGVDDMLGNVEEYIADCQEDYDVCASGCVDPWGSCYSIEESNEVVTRGGSFFHACDVSDRSVDSVWGALTEGIRCVRPASAATRRADVPVPRDNWAQPGRGGQDGTSNTGGWTGVDADRAGMRHAGGGASTASVSSGCRVHTSVETPGRG